MKYRYVFRFGMDDDHHSDGDEMADGLVGWMGLFELLLKENTRRTWGKNKSKNLRCSLRSYADPKL